MRSTAVFRVSVANCSRWASCTDSACFSANSRSAPRRSSGSPPPNGKKPPLPSIPPGYVRRDQVAGLDLALELRDRSCAALSAAANGEAPPGSSSCSRRRVAAPIASRRSGVASCGDRRPPRAAPAAASASSIPSGPRAPAGRRGSRSARRDRRLRPHRRRPRTTLQSRQQLVAPGDCSRASRRCGASRACRRAVDRAEVDPPPGFGLGCEQSRHDVAVSDVRGHEPRARPSSSPSVMSPQ